MLKYLLFVWMFCWTYLVFMFARSPVSLDSGTLLYVVLWLCSTYNCQSLQSNKTNERFLVIIILVFWIMLNQAGFIYIWCFLFLQCLLLIRLGDLSADWWQGWPSSHISSFSFIWAFSCVCKLSYTSAILSIWHN